MLLLNDCKFVFSNSPTKNIRNWGFVIQGLKGLESTFCKHYITCPKNIQIYIRKTKKKICSQLVTANLDVQKKYNCDFFSYSFLLLLDF